MRKAWHTLSAWGYADLVVDENVLEHGTDDVTASHVIADLNAGGLEVPLLVTVKSGHVNTAGDVDGLWG